MSKASTLLLKGIKGKHIVIKIFYTTGNQILGNWSLKFEKWSFFQSSMEINLNTGKLYKFVCLIP